MNSLTLIERDVLLNQYGRWLWVLRMLPDHAARWLSGIALPPHERYMLKMFFSDYKENNIVASRGTSKSFTLGSLASPLKALLYKNLNHVVISASGFRGGKFLFQDTEKLFRGQLRSQRLPQPFLKRSLRENQNKPIKREPDKWTVQLKSNSDMTTVPSNDEDSLRGIRGNVVLIDERNTFDGDVVHAVIRPWMNVGLDFRRTASGGDKNQLFQVSTIDYTVRDWYPEIQESRALAKREYEAHKARKGENWDLYDKLMSKDENALRDASISYTRFDYTDLLIPEYVEDSDGNVYKVNYPVPKELEKEDLLRYDKREERSYWYTYPVDKKGLEEPLLNGTMDEELWLAEQRNVFISTAGNVFPHALLQKASDTPIYETETLREKFGYEDDFFAPLLRHCGDPCVLGVDYARDSDHSAFVVIRLGELAEGEFDPFMNRLDEEGRPLLGKTPWNAVIWAEFWKRMTAQEAADKIRRLTERYNIVRTVHAGEVIRGIGLDKQGGGRPVADNLAQPKPPVDEDGEVDMDDWDPPVKIYDPADEDYQHYGAKEDGETYWGALELIKPTRPKNNEWTMATRALMQQGKLYIAHYESPSDWARSKGITTGTGRPDADNPVFQEWTIGYNGIRQLLKQLQKIQREVTSTGRAKYVMPGDTSRDSNKKDLYSALIYAVHMARQHLTTATKETKKAKNVAPIAMSMSDVASKRQRRGRRRGDTRRYKITRR